MVLDLINRKSRHSSPDGVEVTFRDVTWEDVYEVRKFVLEATDLWYFKDRWDALSTTKKGELNTLRQTLREITTHETANDAADAFPTVDDWIIPTISKRGG